MDPSCKLILTGCPTCCDSARGYRPVQLLKETAGFELFHRYHRRQQCSLSSTDFHIKIFTSVMYSVPLERFAVPLCGVEADDTVQTVQLRKAKRFLSLLVKLAKLNFNRHMC